MTTPSTTSESLAAFDAAHAQLAAAATPELLSAAYALTHRMHVANNLTRDAVERRDRAAADSAFRELRQQRDMIDAEILRRADRRHLESVPL